MANALWTALIVSNPLVLTWFFIGDRPDNEGNEWNIGDSESRESEFELSQNINIGDMAQPADPDFKNKNSELSTDNKVINEKVRRSSFTELKATKIQLTWTGITITSMPK